MLQQTQVSRVVPALERFLARFPTAPALAAADEREVLAHWQGLGYYGRARRLHAAAKAIVERHGGEVPAEAPLLRDLPGVGRYTAGAISSIAFGKREPIVDTNIGRVLLRIDGIAGRRLEGETLEATWNRAAAIVAAADDPAACNEGLMELGALVCSARAPRCEACPLRRMCRANASGEAATIPPPKPAARRLRVHHHAIVVERGPAVLLEQRPERGLWASMWQVPTVESEIPLDPDVLADRIGIGLAKISLRERIEHRTTHRDVVFLVHAGRTRMRRDPAPRRWVRRDELSEYPLSNPMRRILDAQPPAALAGGSAAGAIGAAVEG
jgi:A/G-specific adenine glycosylase